MATLLVNCWYCHSELVYKHGHARSGEPRYRCRDCHRCFQVSYRYEANKDGIPEKIIDMAMNGSGVRDIRRVLGVSITTVIAHLKKIKPRQSQSSPDSSFSG